MLEQPGRSITAGSHRVKALDIYIEKNSKDISEE
ncbi:hypothetical protein SDC9_167009 [bioreactor metagenome]|uniref:Uncharacterized protein n=1 Tax=bioreactor metagenome TaxID=1076179 RepID=A0A645FYM1_9ZZZZ